LQNSFVSIYYNIEYEIYIWRIVRKELKILIAVEKLFNEISKFINDILKFIALKYWQILKYEINKWNMRNNY